jgi:uncharacterized protein YndB with AHSA1/START domain
MMEVKVKHRFSASAERVYDAWLDPARVGKFLFVTGTGQMVRCEIDARVGGRFTLVERRSGEEVLHTGTYLELERPRRIVFTLSVPKYSSDEGRVVIEIEAKGTGSELTLTQELPDSQKDNAARATDGWQGILELADEVVAGDGDGEPSCGRGLAQHSTIPAKMAAMLSALAETLSTHRAMLVLEDPASQREDEVYDELARTFANIASLTQKAAERMASQHELPMGKHDMSAWGAAQMQAFQRFVAAEGRLLAHAKVAAERDQKMLESMQKSE